MPKRIKKFLRGFKPSQIVHIDTDSNGEDLGTRFNEQRFCNFIERRFVFCFGQTNEPMQLCILLNR